MRAKKSAFIKIALKNSSNHSIYFKKLPGMIITGHFEPLPAVLWNKSHIIKQITQILVCNKYQRNDWFTGVTNFQEWQILGNDEFSGTTNLQKRWIYRNDKFSGMTNFREWQIFGNDEFLGMTNFWEWQCFGTNFLDL